MVHRELLARRGKNAPDLRIHRQTGGHSTNPALHLPEERFGSEFKTVGTTRLLSVKQGARSPMGNTSSCFCWGEKGYIQAPHKKICCCGFQLLSGISLQPRSKHFGSLWRTVVAPHHGHQHVLWLAKAAPCQATLPCGPCLRVPRALSALCFFLGQTHPLVCYEQGGKVVCAYLTLPCLCPHLLASCHHW